MFVFKGQPKVKNSLKLARYYKTLILIYAIFGAVGFALLILLPSCLIFKIKGLYALAGFPIFELLMIAFALDIVNYSAIVFNDNTIDLYKKDSKNDKFCCSISCEEILSIDVFKDYYICTINEMCFKKSNDRTVFLLQKNLLKQGTLEEFEERFKDKIIVKEQEEPKK